MKRNSLEKFKLYYERDDVTFRKIAPHTTTYFEEQLVAFRLAFKKAKTKTIRKRIVKIKKRELFAALNADRDVIQDAHDRLGHLL